MLFCRFCTLSNRVNFRILHQLNNFRLVASKSSTAAAAEDKRDEEEDLDKPVKFTSSAARRWQAKTARQGRQESRLWYEPYVILTSLTIFMIYFTIFREENDVDQELTRSLYSRIKGLEEHQLRVSLEYNKDHNLDTTAIIKRLKEIELEKSKQM